MVKVLVVDDEWDIRELLVDTIIDTGLDVIEAADGEAALERVKRDRPDVILLDIWMPGLDGLGVLERLRNDPETETIPVVLLTAMPATEGEVAGMDLGVTHYITKPWEPGVVESTIRVALRESGHTVKNDPGEELTENAETTIESEGVNLTADTARITSMMGALTKLKSGRKKKQVITNKEGEEIEVITTADRLTALDKKMGGGLPIGTVNLAVGAASSGKSVFCQHMVFGALEGGYGTAFFSSEHSPDSLVEQMRSINLDISRHLRANKIHIYPVPEPEEGEKAEMVLEQLSQSLENLSRGAQFIVLDSMSDLIGSCSEQAVIGFFTACRRLANKGRTIFVCVHSYAFGSEMFNRLRTLCDGYFTLGSGQVMGKSIRILEVNKINTTEMGENNMVSFVVEPEVGMRVIPLSRTKA